MRSSSSSARARWRNDWALLLIKTSRAEGSTELVVFRWWDFDLRWPFTAPTTLDMIAHQAMIDGKAEMEK